MHLIPQPNRKKLTTAATRAGHVVSGNRDSVTIESTDTKLWIYEHGPIVDADGTTYTVTEAAAKLDVELRSYYSV